MSCWFAHAPTVEHRAERRRAENRRRFFANRDAAAQRQSWAYFESAIHQRSPRVWSAALYIAWQNRLRRRLRNP
jgi:hypothetical protein